MSLDAATLGGYVGTLVAGAWALCVQFKSGRQADQKENAEKLKVAHDDLVATKDGVISTLRDEKEAWKVRFDGIHTEYEDYRKETHARLNKANETVLRLTDENHQLHAKTDMTPVLKNQEQQSQVNEKVLEALGVITAKLQALTKEADTKG